MESKATEGFAWERSVYRALGIRYFKKIVPLGDYWVYLIRLVWPGFKIIANRQSAMVWAIFTICVELLHGIAALALIVISITQA